MNFKKRVNGSWVDTPNYIHNTSTDTITTLPAVLYPTGTTATVGLKGNTVQSGTPTPDNPIMPQGTGDRTGNLLQNVLSSTEINGVTVTVNADKSITVNGSLAVGGNTYVTVGTVAFESGEKYTIDGVSGYLPSTLQLFTQSSSAFAIGNRLQSYNGYVTRTAAASETCDIRLYFYPNVIYDNVTVYPQIVKGDAKPYEPYGYKIPISSASTTTPIYLGEVETTRKAKKLVLTGTETIDTITVAEQLLFRFNAFYTKDKLIGNVVNTLLCDVYKIVNGRAAAALAENNYSMTTYNSTNDNRLIVHDDRFTTVEDFKAYLAQQYTAGTPVTVWYVLATPETAVVNEPLMKIGEYADTVSGITIPIITGKDTFDVQTALKPSEVELAYTGWHDSTVKEWDGSQWN